MITVKRKHLPELAAAAGGLSGLVALGKDLIPVQQIAETALEAARLVTALSTMLSLALCVVLIGLALAARESDPFQKDSWLFKASLIMSSISYTCMTAFMSLFGEFVFADIRLLLGYWCFLVVYFVLLRTIRGPIN